MVLFRLLRSEHFEAAGCLRRPAEGTTSGAVSSAEGTESMWSAEEMTLTGQRVLACCFCTTLVLRRCQSVVVAPPLTPPLFSAPRPSPAKLDCIFGCSTSNNSIENQIVGRALHHCLHHHARKDTKDTPASLRATLMVNSAQKEEYENINNATFTYPMEPDGMHEAAEATVLCCLNNPQASPSCRRLLQK